ncbi:RNA polymerase sigma factor [Paenibacillus vietnamensis]|uniref:RNA polymerase sigma factor n=1 Tax=Paenibacillus vietnamensis TaxID=2590547 RepID=UPI001CD10CAE|nr:RNA polymerase sigma factor [Paenibacillus vietnamensis]
MDWKPLLFQYSRHLAGNHWDAEDLTQEAWLKLNEALRKQPERPVTKAFLYRIVKNTWIDAQRKRRLRTVPLAPSHEASEPDPMLASRELLEQLAERLPPKMAVILLLMDVFDFTAKETSEYVGMKEAATQVTLGRARRKLKELAKDAHSVKRLPVPFQHSVRFDELVEAFRRRDPDAIYRAFIGLKKRGHETCRAQDGRRKAAFYIPGSGRERLSYGIQNILSALFGLAAVPRLYGCAGPYQEKG